MHAYDGKGGCVGILISECFGTYPTTAEMYQICYALLISIYYSYFSLSTTPFFSIIILAEDLLY